MHSNASKAVPIYVQNSLRSNIFNHRQSLFFSANIVPETELQGEREILVGLTDSIGNATLCGHTAAQRMSVTQEITCQSGPINGQFVTIRPKTATRLVIGHVMVFIVGYGYGQSSSHIVNQKHGSKKAKNLSLIQRFYDLRSLECLI